MEKMLSSVLTVIRPSKQELSSEIAFAKEVLAHIKKYSPRSCDVVLTGSMAKKTFLFDKKDLDIFVLFGRGVPREKLESHITGIMKKAFPSIGYKLSYAEHPYVRFHYGGRRIDLVPAYKIANATERISAVDRSTLHTKFVLRNLKKNNIGDVLLLKQLLHANSLYGAEIKIKGFSGYLCELLIIRYGGFTKLLRVAAKWKKPTFIDLKKYYKTKKSTIGATERFGFFVVIDPADKDRNVAAAVSDQNFLAFTKLCKVFLKKPNRSFFLRQPETFDEKLEKIIKKNKSVFLVSMPKPDVVDDVLWGQVHKMVGQFERHLEDFDPKSIVADDSGHLIRLVVVLGTEKLPREMLVEGPPLKMKKPVLLFRKSHKKSKFVKKNKKIFAVARRPITYGAKSIREFFRNFSKIKSHLNYHEEMILIEKLKYKAK
ncbi:MAG: CCA tRNA nucleotidyltransferase [Candidatus Micrarchaeota archaeon]|nr:CCA tRNA nucleotidyltransferase [Candidatus Micrarchaeota archaeon]MBU1887331.1 CCA tRNA nucleotidyltransferase [Candidatus Micrarchaeota archaeon]